MEVSGGGGDVDIDEKRESLSSEEDSGRYRDNEEEEEEEEDDDDDDEVDDDVDDGKEESEELVGCDADAHSSSQSFSGSDGEEYGEAPSTPLEDRVNELQIGVRSNLKFRAQAWNRFSDLQRCMTKKNEAVDMSLRSVETTGEMNRNAIHSTNRRQDQLEEEQRKDRKDIDRIKKRLDLEDE